MKRILLCLPLLAFLASCGREPVVLNVMTFNIRYDNPEDSLNNWKYRKDIVAKVILDNAPDVLGAQEVLANQFEDMKACLPGYVSLGIGREDGVDKGEHSAVFYRSDRFTRMDYGYFWISETPDVAGSMGWDAACERIATWVILEDNASGRQFFFINTHLDHEGLEARREGVELLLSQCAVLSRGLPVIMAGDFNAVEESDVVARITNPTRPYPLRHARPDGASARKYWSFHGFGEVPLEERVLLDYIFVSGDIEVLRYEILPEKEQGRYISDHCGIMAQLKLREQKSDMHRSD